MTAVSMLPTPAGTTVRRQAAQAGQTPAKRIPRFDPAAHRVTFPRVLRSEWAKLWSLRSTTIMLGLMAAIVIAMTALAGIGIRDYGVGEKPAQAGLDLTMMFTQVIAFATGIIAMLFGALSSAGEFTTGQIRSSFAAVPTRLPWLAGKSVVVGAVIYVSTLIVNAAGLGIGLGIATARHMAIALPGHQILLSVLAQPVHNVCIALLALGIGVLLRNSAGAITSTFGLMWVLPSIVQLLPFSWTDGLADWLPNQSGAQIWADAADLNAATGGRFGGLAITVAWSALALIGAAVTLKKRDA
jgi:ABC-type transport system involved in multi-copper enzyme maturation permease subunit